MRSVKSEDEQRFSRKEVLPSSTDSSEVKMDKEDCSHPNHRFLEPNVENKERAKCCKQSTKEKSCALAIFVKR